LIHITDILLAQPEMAACAPESLREIHGLLLQAGVAAEMGAAVAEKLGMPPPGANPRERVSGMDDLLLRDYADAFARLLSRNPEAELCPGDGYGCAAALAVEWIQRGGQNLAVSFLGKGGFAPLEEVLMALRVTRRYRPGLNLGVLPALRAAVERATGETVPPCKPVVGARIFHVESGIHVNGILKNASNYELFSPETVGMTRTIRLGKHSGKSAVAYKLRERGVSLGAETVGLLLRDIREMSIRLTRGITEEEFDELIQKRAGL
jgi:homocitrate synthase NifV